MFSFSFAPEHTVSLIIAFMSLVGICYTAYSAASCKKDTGQINEAVNHRKPGELRLYEIMTANQASIIKLDERFDTIEERIDELTAKVSQCPVHAGRLWLPSVEESLPIILDTPQS